MGGRVGRRVGGWMLGGLCVCEDMTRPRGCCSLLGAIARAAKWAQLEPSPPWGAAGGLLSSLGCKELAVRSQWGSGPRQGLRRHHRLSVCSGPGPCTGSPAAGCSASSCGLGAPVGCLSGSPSVPSSATRCPVLWVGHSVPTSLKKAFIFPGFGYKESALRACVQGLVRPLPMPPGGLF